MSAAAVIESSTFNVATDNIDTDQIIPARFLTTTEREGMGRFCFHDWRFNEDGSDRADNPLRTRTPEQNVLVAGSNFGCGSSREHAPWALLDFGFKAVVSSRFADIFRSNSLKNGLLPVTVEQDMIDFLMAHPGSGIAIDINKRTVEVEGFGCREFPLDPFSAYCLIRGIDQMDFILQNDAQVSAYEQKHGK